MGYFRGLWVPVAAGLVLAASCSEKTPSIEDMVRAENTRRDAALAQIADEHRKRDEALAAWDNEYASMKNSPNPLTDALKFMREHDTDGNYRLDGKNPREAAVIASSDIGSVDSINRGVNSRFTYTPHHMDFPFPTEMRNIRLIDVIYSLSNSPPANDVLLAKAIDALFNNDYTTGALWTIDNRKQALALKDPRFYKPLLESIARKGSTDVPDIFDNFEMMSVQVP